jgi:hypothetical protein
VDRVIRVVWGYLKDFLTDMTVVTAVTGIIFVLLVLLVLLLSFLLHEDGEESWICSPRNAAILEQG